MLICYDPSHWLMFCPKINRALSLVECIGITIPNFRVREASRRSIRVFWTMQTGRLVSRHELKISVVHQLVVCIILLIFVWIASLCKTTALMVLRTRNTHTHTRTHTHAHTWNKEAYFGFWKSIQVNLVLLKRVTSPVFIYEIYNCQQILDSHGSVNVDVM